MEINGLPAHPLVVHAAVVFAPLAALLAIGYVVPPWRDRLRWPVLVGALVAAGVVTLAFYSGNSFRDANAFFSDPSLPVTEKIDRHAELGQVLLYVTLGFAIVAVLNVLLHSRTGAVRVVLKLLLLADAVAVLALVVMTGDAGSQAVWGEGFAG